MLEIVSEELRHYQEQKLIEYRNKNQLAPKGGIVFAGDSLIEFFPLKKLLVHVCLLLIEVLLG
ncbi:hypothetical protein HMPREF1228_0588 [Streptococcus pyogenes GA41345]|nr:hypothetical protein HMPREF1228_0588 [Streptococcus pyogenes GA41345]BAQ51299.1 GDSL-like lipase/acylhydrolase family protein [Streptococcus pyogenes]